jgi:trk system potassium uptake protein TrkA
MKVIICGAGQVGWQIARHLSGEKNDVTVVDSNADLVRRASETLDVQGVAGFASYPDVLEKAGARDADMIIAATHSDEVNMVTCQDRARSRVCAASLISTRSIQTSIAAITYLSTW